VDQDQRIVIFNQGAEKIFGYTAREVWGKPLDKLLPTRFLEVHRKHVDEFGRSPMAARRMGQRQEIAGCRKDGTEFPAEASISKVDIDGRRIYTVILRDITLSRAAEDRIKASLREKEVLLKEVHHRVKNNLQVISSLLKLQARGIHDEATRQKFKESEMRVLSMALIHEQLYQSKSLSEIDFPEYIRQLAGNLFRSYGVSSSRVELKTEIENVALGVDIAVPCGLIINELVSNCLKYAFPEGREGEIRIQLRNTGATLLLSVWDNGVGIPERVGFQDTKTLGLRLVGTLVRQLEGDVEVDRSNGAEVRVTFALQPQ
jgi:PAS domain S-box-containing protein